MDLGGNPHGVLGNDRYLGMPWYSCREFLIKKDKKNEKPLETDLVWIKYRSDWRDHLKEKHQKDIRDCKSEGARGFGFMGRT